MTPTATPGSPQAFNLIDVDVNSSDSLIFTWDGDSNQLVYTVCKKDTSGTLENDCLPLATISEANTATVNGVNIFDANNSQYFVLAQNESGSAQSSEKEPEAAVLTGLIERLKSSSKGEYTELYVRGISDDGKVVIVTSYYESSDETGVNVVGGNENTPTSGQGVYLTWC